jgi:hypothetical protein
MKKLWFRRKTYGYGWTPSSWEGWLMIALYVVFNVLHFHYIEVHYLTQKDTVPRYIGGVILSTVILILLCVWKGEKPKWQWGSTETKNTKKD